VKNFIAKYYQPFILFSLTFIVASIFSRLGIDPHHQGIMFKPALDVAHGQMLFRDTFTQYGALATLLHACALRIFGDYLVVIQIETAFFYALISVCLYYLWLRILPRWLTVLSIVIWLLLAPYYIWTFIPWSSVPALFFQILSLLLVLSALRKQSRLMILAAGAVAILVFWCRQPVGAFHCASLIFFLATTPLITGEQWKRAILNCVIFITGVLIVSAFFILWLALNNALHDMYLQSIKAAFFFGVKATDTSQNIWTAVLRALFTYAYEKQTFQTSFLWILLPLVCVCMMAALIVKRYRNQEGSKDDLPLYGLLFISLASWLQYYPFPCIRHCYWAATPMIGVFPYSIWQLCRFKNQKIKIMMVCLILMAAFGYDVEQRFYWGQKKISMNDTEFKEQNVLRGMYETPFNASKYQSMAAILNDAVKENPTHYLVDLTSDALYLTFIGPQVNFQPMYIGWGGYTDFIYPDFTKRTFEFIHSKYPVVLSYEGRKIPGWICVAVFNEIDFANRSHHINRKLALYRFAGNHDAL